MEMIGNSLNSYLLFLQQVGKTEQSSGLELLAGTPVA